MSAKATYSVFEGGQWLPLADVPEGILVTGQVRKFRAEAAGYYPEVFSLKIAPYQTELVLRANLVPLSSVLTVDATERSIRIRLNGSERIILGGEDMIEGTLADFRGGKRSWNLPSGRYELVASDGKHQTVIPFTLTPEEPVSLKISTDANVIRIDKE